MSKSMANLKAKISRFNGQEIISCNLLHKFNDKFYEATASFDGNEIDERRVLTRVIKNYQKAWTPYVVTKEGGTNYSKYRVYLAGEEIRSEEAELSRRHNEKKKSAS